MSSEQARLVVANIEADMVDRRGLRQAWEAIGDHAITCEILGAWAAIVDRFIAVAVIEEREACAKIAHAEVSMDDSGHRVAKLIERLIRARGTR